MRWSTAVGVLTRPIINEVSKGKRTGAGDGS